MESQRGTNYPSRIPTASDLRKEARRRRNVRSRSVAGALASLGIVGGSAVIAANQFAITAQPKTASVVVQPVANAASATTSAAVAPSASPRTTNAPTLATLGNNSAAAVVVPSHSSAAQSVTSGS